MCIRDRDKELDHDLKFAHQEEMKQRKDLLKDSIKVLNDREREILYSRRLNDDPTTLEDLSKKYKISRERVRQIENKAFEKLQKHMLLLAKSKNLLPEVLRMLEGKENHQILLYCTGGIRCEKASAYLIKKGFTAEILDAEAENLTHEKTAEKIAQKNPKLAIFMVYGQQPSASTQCMPGGKKTCLKLNEITSNEIKSIVIGTHASALPKKTLEEEPSPTDV